ncbi:hypothetical protein ACFWTC_29795 [Streptomyces sp. NPDC058619]|uniref:hypothetical protein n=1 Tax=unclassified Streptomyces TaxID=2593676 RepID=UPI003667D1DA
MRVHVRERHDRVSRIVREFEAALSALRLPATLSPGFDAGALVGTDGTNSTNSAGGAGGSRRLVELLPELRVRDSYGGSATPI